MPSREYERNLNVYTAQLFRKRGLDAKPEVNHLPKGMTDIEVKIGPAVVAVEFEHGDSRAKKTEAIKDADRKLERKLANCAVAACYPDDSDEHSLQNADFMWTVRGKVGADENWTVGSLDQLVQVIRLTPAQLGNPDYAAASLSASLDAAVQRMDETQKRGLARSLDLPSVRKKGRVSWDQAAKRAMLVIATAVMFHSRLDGFMADAEPSIDNRQTPPIQFSGEWPPTPAHVCVESDTPINDFRDAWNLILALDYKPIFETGRAALAACPPNPAFSDAIRTTAKAALVVAENIAGLRHDLLGRIFHTVLDSARYDGSFYTSTPAATLLSSLALKPDICDWTDPSAIAELKVTDPACGTGTLLMAVAERVRDMTTSKSGGELDESTARSVIEDVLTGYDVNLTATHMAATTLGLLSPTTQFSKMKIGRTLLGVRRRRAYLGSLEYLDENPMMLPWPNSESKARQVDTDERMTAPNEQDLIIMNPPFTRDSLRHDQFSKEHEQMLKAREKDLFAGLPVHLSSNGNGFLVLAEHLVKRDSGTVAAILPLVTATNASSMGIRRFLADRFHVETIVTSHDPDRIYFSENTTIGEMLLVCRRWNSDSGEKPPTRVVNLAINPHTPTDAISLAWEIEDGSVESKGHGTIQSWPSGKIRDGDWGAVQFLSPFLCEQFAKLAKFQMFNSTPMAYVATVGPDGRGSRGAFTQSTMPGKDGMRALWDHKTDVIQSMSAKPDRHIVPKSGKDKQAKSLWNKRGRLLLPMRARLNTVRMNAVRLQYPALGSAWVPCKPYQVEDVPTITVEKALCVYLNSSIGILAMLGNRSNKIPSYPQFSMDDLNKLVVPNFPKLQKRAITALARVYDNLKNSTVKPMPEMESCDTRKALDKAICTALKVDAELVANIRAHLVAEPSVTGKRYSG